MIGDWVEFTVTAGLNALSLNYPYSQRFSGKIVGYVSGNPCCEISEPSSASHIRIEIDERIRSVTRHKSMIKCAMADLISI